MRAEWFRRFSLFCLFCFPVISMVSAEALAQPKEIRFCSIIGNDVPDQVTDFYRATRHEFKILTTRGVTIAAATLRDAADVMRLMIQTTGPCPVEKHSCAIGSATNGTDSRNSFIFIDPIEIPGEALMAHFGSPLEGFQALQILQEIGYCEKPAAIKLVK